jgi:hypothetical protein
MYIEPSLYQMPSGTGFIFTNRSKKFGKKSQPRLSLQLPRDTFQIVPDHRQHGYIPAGIFFFLQLA